MTLTEFLLARIAEDEADLTRWYRESYAKRPDLIAGYEADRSGYGFNDNNSAECGVGRVLAECEAKRRIVEQADREGGYTGRERWVLLSLVTVYADHSDYRSEWST